jgi:hypothetical protein
VPGPNQTPGPTAIRSPTPSISNHQTVLTQLKETTETAQRIRGNPLQSYVTLGELINAGIVKFLGGVVSPGDKIGGGRGGGSVTTADSIQGSGSVASPIELVGDSASPGNSMLYGTNGSGTKGWYAQPGGGSLTVTDGTHTVTGATNLHFNGAVVSGTTPNAVVTISGGSVAVPGTIPDLVFWVDTSNVLGAAGATVNRIQEHTPWIGGVAAYPAVAGHPALIDATQLNGLNVLTWVASSTAAYNMQPGFWMIGGGTYFFVGRGLNNTKTGSQALIASQTPNTLALYLSNSTGSQFVSIVNEGVATIGICSVAWVLGTFFQMNVTYNASTGAFAFRQARAAANSGMGTTGVSASAALNTLGDDQFGSTLGGSIAELIAYNRVLSPTEITNVENYLFAKWGV